MVSSDQPEAAGETGRTDDLNWHIEPHFWPKTSRDSSRLWTFSRWPWTSPTPRLSSILSSPLLSAPSLSSHVPFPVIACQINVPLCSQAKKLSCHIRLLLPWYFPLLFYFLWVYISLLSSLVFCPHTPLCLLPFWTLGFFRRAASAVLSAPSPPRGTDASPSSASIYFSRSVSLCVFVLPCANVLP